MSKRTKVPRASLACTMLDDPDLIALLQDSSGIQAYSVFCLLLLAAKVQNNGGEFNHSTAVIAAMVRLPVESFKAGLATLAQRTNWVVTDANHVTIRSYKKWNSWGGSRDNAGRKSSKNQVETKPQSKPDVPVSVSDPVKTTTLPQDKPAKISKPRKPHWSEPIGSALATLPGNHKNGPWSFLNKLGLDYSRPVVLAALAQVEIEKFANWGHAAGSLTEACRRIKSHTPVGSTDYDIIDGVRQ